MRRMKRSAVGQRQAQRDVPRDDPEAGSDQMRAREGVAEMTGAEPGCVSEQDGVAGSGCGVRSALKCCNTEAVAGACGARGGARGGEGGSASD